MRYKVIELIGYFGQQAASAVPVLTRITQGKNELLHSLAQVALEQIRAGGR